MAECIIVEAGVVLNDPPTVDIIDLDGIEDQDDDTLAMMLHAVEAYSKRNPEDTILRYAWKIIANEYDYRTETRY